MLFHPYEPKKIFGITFHGFIPKRKQNIAEKIAKLVSAGFFSSADIEDKISDPANLHKVMPMIEEHVNDFLQVKLSKEMPILSMFIGDKTITTLKKVFMQEIENLFPQVMKQFATNLKNELDLESIVIKKVSALSTVKLEEMLYKGLSGEFRSFEITGAVIGFIIGIVQVVITLLIS